MVVTIHFVPNPTREAELESHLHALGFEVVKRLPGGRHVLLTAPAEEITSRLGLDLHEVIQERKVGPAHKPVKRTEVSASAQLPSALAEIVGRWYLPRPPDLLAPEAMCPLAVAPWCTPMAMSRSRARISSGVRFP